MKNKLITKFDQAVVDFEKKSKEVKIQIKEKLLVAKKSLKEAEQLANKHGIPFYSEISPISQNYLPPSFFKKWTGLTRDVFEKENKNEDYDGVMDELLEQDPRNTGWQHSAICSYE